MALCRVPVLCASSAWLVSRDTHGSSASRRCVTARLNYTSVVRTQGVGVGCRQCVALLRATALSWCIAQAKVFLGSPI